MPRDYLYVYLFLLLIGKEADCAITIPKFVHQKDLSELCRRRVIPSIFLGKQIKDANLNVMRFSRLDLPYSCMVTIRYECKKNPDQFVVYELGETFGGYWGALPESVIQQASSNRTKYYTTKTTTFTTTRPTTISIEQSSKYDSKSHSFLKHSVTMHTKKEDGYIRVEVPLVNISGSVQLEDSRLPSDFDEMFDDFYDVLPRKGSNYRTSVMPLLQFSVKHQKGRGHDDEPRYEIDYNVQGYNSFTQDSRLVFSTVNKKVATKKRNWYANRRLNYDRKNRLFSMRNSSLNLNKFFTTPWAPLAASHKFERIPVLKTKINYSNIKADELNNTTESWVIIDNLIKSYKFTATSDGWTEPAVLSNVIEMISNITHNNISAYLLSNENNKQEDKESLKFTNKKNFDLFTKKSLQQFLMRSDALFSSETPITKISSSSNTHITSGEFSTESIIKSTHISTEEKNEAAARISEISLEPGRTTAKENTNYTRTTTTADLSEINRKKISPNFENNITDSQKFTSDTHNEHKSNYSFTQTTKLKFTGSMVDHESWENIVQAAPVMANVLNNTETFLNNRTFNSRLNSHGKTNNYSNLREKRYIQPLDIDKSKPRDLTTIRVAKKVTDDNNDVADMQDLANLLELQDDEIQGRLALRYLRNYIGPVLFNICDFGQAKFQRVHLLNSSRIVLAITNFTLDKVTLVITPAITLMNNEMGCPLDHCECQILGTRVCVDDINACDGVPNCGTNEIYDEDRFLCGANSDIQYIFLTALTFIAVILTAFYTVHYWLRRCVPKVSEAFFVYTDTSENTLYLDSVMRSPTDGDITSSKCQYPDHYFESDFADDITSNREVSIFRRLMRTCLNILLCKRRQEVDKNYQNELIELPSIEPKKLYSFTKLELSKMTTSTTTKEEITQTGDSLLMDIKEIKRSQESDKKGTRPGHSSDEMFVKRNVIGGKYKKQEHINELDLIKLTKNLSAHSSDYSYTRFTDNNKSQDKLRRRPTTLNDDEKELKSTLYERQNILSPQLRENTVKHENTDHFEPLDKHLRFEEEPIMIPSIESIIDEKLKIRRKRDDTLEVPSFSGRYLTTKESDNTGHKSTSKSKKSKKTAKMFKN